MANSLESRLMSYSAFIRDANRPSSIDRDFSRLIRAYDVNDFQKASSVAVKLIDQYRWDDIDIQLIFYTVVTGILSDAKLVKEEENYIDRCLCILKDYIPGEKVKMDYEIIKQFGIEGVYKNIVLDTIGLSLRNNDHKLSAGYCASLVDLFPNDEDYIGSTGLLFALSSDYETAMHYLSQCRSESFRFFLNGSINGSSSPIDFLDDAQQIRNRKLSSDDEVGMDIIYETLLNQM